MCLEIMTFIESIKYYKRLSQGYFSRDEKDRLESLAMSSFTKITSFASGRSDLLTALFWSSQKASWPEKSHMVAKYGESLGGNDLPSISTEENNIAVLLWPGYLAEKSADMGSGIHISPGK